MLAFSIEATLAITAASSIEAAEFMGALYNSISSDKVLTHPHVSVNPQEDILTIKFVIEAADSEAATRAARSIIDMEVKSAGLKVKDVSTEEPTITTLPAISQ